MSYFVATAARIHAAAIFILSPVVALVIPPRFGRVISAVISAVVATASAAGIRPITASRIHPPVSPFVAAFAAAAASPRVLAGATRFPVHAGRRRSGRPLNPISAVATGAGWRFFAVGSTPTGTAAADPAGIDGAGVSCSPFITAPGGAYFTGIWIRSTANRIFALLTALRGVLTRLTTPGVVSTPAAPPAVSCRLPPVAAILAGGAALVEVSRVLRTAWSAKCRADH